MSIYITYMQASVSGPWELCTGRISYYHDAGSMIPYHQNLTTKGYKALIFSGDHDMCVPYTGSQAWTSSLGYKIVDQWRSWRSNDQVAGYLQAYENNLTFLTVKVCLLFRFAAIFFSLHNYCIANKKVVRSSLF